MAVGFRAVGTWENGATGLTADEVLAVPAAQVTGDLVIVLAAWKTFSITAQVAGYTEITQFADGTTGTGNGTGSMKVGAWYKVATSDTEADPTLDFNTTTNLLGEGVIIVMSKGAGELWSTPLFVTAAHTTWTTSAQTTNASSTVTVPSGGAVIGLASVRDDTATFTRPTTGVSGSGPTWNGNYVEAPATHASTTTGNDMAVDAGYRLVTTGAAGVTLTQTATLSAADTGSLLWIILGAFTPENHNGGVTATGGGVYAQAAQKGANLSSALTGGGVLSWVAEAAQVENHDGAIVATGGGVLSFVGSKGGQRAAALATGGGVLSTASTSNHSGSPTATGGGVIAVAFSGAHRGAPTATAGGAVGEAGSKGATVHFASTGGGVLTTASTVGHSGAFGGTGGGRALVGQAGAHNESFAATGSGALVFTGTQLEAHAGHFAATGGGMFSLTILGVITPPPPHPPRSRGGRFANIRVPTRRGGFRATGGGRLVFVGIADWNDDDLVVEMLMSA